MIAEIFAWRRRSVRHQVHLLPILPPDKYEIISGVDSSNAGTTAK
jgi:hypothetical protein